MKALALLVVVAVSGWFGYQYLTQSASPSETVSPPRPSVQQTAPTLTTISAPTPNPAVGEVTVEVDEATLSQQLNEAVAGKTVAETPLGPARLNSLAVRLREGEIRIEGNGEAGGMRVPVDATGSVAAEANQPKVRLSEARVAGVPLPDESTRQIESTLQVHLDQQVARQRMQVRAITVGDGRISIVGSPAS